MATQHCIAFAVICVAGFLSPAAHAQSDAQRTATAKALYDAALNAMAQKDFASACPKLEEAVRLEPEALGAQFALAECYEGAGRRANSWLTYVRIEQAASKTQQEARRQKAHDLAAALRVHLAPREFAGVCPILERAVWLEPEALDSQFALAECYEGAHRLAASWLTYLRIEQLALKAQQEAPRQQAHHRAAELIGRLARQDFEYACPLLEQAGRHDRESLDTQFTLAECHEGAGRLATAWAAYLRIEQAASRTQQDARRQKAHDRATELERRVARLTIDVPPEIRALASLAIQRDGVPVSPVEWGVPIPVDRGTHTIVVTATDKQRQEITVDVKADGDAIVRTIPMLSHRAGLPWLHIEAQRPVPGLALHFHLLEQGVECYAPCDAIVDAQLGKQFVLDGGGIVPSEPFVLNDRSGRWVLTVKPASSTPKWVGVGFIAVGVPAGILSAALLGAEQKGDNAVTYGALLGGSLSTVLLGTVLVLTTGKTTYSFTEF